MFTSIYSLSHDNNQRCFVFFLFKHEPFLTASTELGVTTIGRTRVHIQSITIPDTKLHGAYIMHTMWKKIKRTLNLYIRKIREMSRPGNQTTVRARKACRHDSIDQGTRHDSPGQGTRHDSSDQETRHDSPDQGTMQTRQSRPGNQTRQSRPGNQTRQSRPGNQTRQSRPGNQTRQSWPGNQTRQSWPGNQTRYIVQTRDPDTTVLTREPGTTVQTREPCKHDSYWNS